MPRRAAELSGVLLLCASCAARPTAPDATTDAVTHERAAARQDAAPDELAPRRDAAPRDRADVEAPARCFGAPGPPGLLTHVASIPRESWASSNGASGCVGDVDNDGRREFVLLRMNEPSELIGGDFCTRGRVLLPELARDCVIADVDGAPGNEIVVMSSVGWTAESFVTVGRVRATRATDDVVDRFVFDASATLDERRPVSPVGASHVAVTDLDHDGLVELAVSGNYPAAFARVWRRSSSQWTAQFAQDLVTVMDESHGWVVGDADGDGLSEALLLSSCGVGDRHVIRRFDRWANDARDTLVSGPVHAAIADLDGVAPPELATVERTHCQERRPTPTAALHVRRWDPTAGAFVSLASIVTERPPNELRYVATMDLVDTPAHEIIQCSAPRSPRRARPASVHRPCVERGEPRDDRGGAIVSGAVVFDFSRAALDFE